MTQQFIISTVSCITFYASLSCMLNTEKVSVRKHSFSSLKQERSIHTFNSTEIEQDNSGHEEKNCWIIKKKNFKHPHTQINFQKIYLIDKKNINTNPHSSTYCENIYPAEKTEIVPTISVKRSLERKFFNSVLPDNKHSYDVPYIESLLASGVNIDAKDKIINKTALWLLLNSCHESLSQNTESYYDLTNKQHTTLCYLLANGATVYKKALNQKFVNDIIPNLLKDTYEKQQKITLCPSNQ